MMGMLMMALATIPFASCSPSQSKIEELQELHAEVMTRAKDRLTHDERKECLNKLNQLDGEIADLEFEPEVDRKIKKMLRDCYELLLG